MNYQIKKINLNTSDKGNKEGAGKVVQNLEKAIEKAKKRKYNIAK